MSSCLLLTAALPPTEWPQTLTLGSIPRFFYTSTCPSCLDPVASGNQTAESELRKPHPVSGNPPGPRLLNSHSDPSQSPQPTSKQGKLGHWTHTTPSASWGHTSRPPRLLRAGMWSKWVTFLCKDSCLDSYITVKRWGRPKNGPYLHFSLKGIMEIFPVWLG